VAKSIDAEVITAPILADGHVYLTNLAGTLFSFRQTDGGLAWQSAKNATSSPMVWKGECYFSQREERTGQTGGTPETYQTEQVAVQGAYPNAATRAYLKTVRRADYLDHAKRLRGSPRYVTSAAMDAQVGFASHKGDAQMHLAMRHLGRGNVHEVWSYQGSTPFVHRGRLYSALGDAVQCLDPATREVQWKKHLGAENPGAEMLDNLLTPPSTVNGKLFLGSIHGDVFCLSAETGDEIWRFRVGEAIIFPPAVAKGRAYVPTDKGVLYCLETGDEQDDGWNSGEQRRLTMDWQIETDLGHAYHESGTGNTSSSDTSHWPRPTLTRAVFFL
jgi:outer membrane protein assembly factor BamB